MPEKNMTKQKKRKKNSTAEIVIIMTTNILLVTSLSNSTKIQYMHSSGMRFARLGSASVYGNAGEK